jgi:hypothetical protein
MHTKFLLKSLKGRDCLEDVGVDGKIIVEWILGKDSEKMWTEFIWLGIWTTGGFL